MGFINPYTFIPVNNGVKKPYNEYYKDKKNLLSGKIECTLRARTQLAVCDMISDTEAEFFKVDGKAVIPGSSLRGTIRSIFEALTDSCFSSANAESDDYFSSRLNKKFSGLIEYNKSENKYILYKAERYKDEKNNQLSEYKTGDEVSFNYYSKNGRGSVIRYFKDVNEGFNKGYVHKVDKLNNKDSIFEKKGKGTVISEKSIILLAENIKKYEPKIKEIGEEYKNQFEEMKKGNGMLPVWYHKDGDRYYFAPSQMSRAIFYTQPIDMLKKKKLDVCSDKNNVCETCALFGIISKQNSEFVKSSKLRFSDAVCEDKDCFDKKYTLLLAKPRISSFEFYLKSDKNQYCADDEGVTIAGRKYYWHNTSKIKDIDVTDTNKNIVRNVELVKAGSEFSFCVYFDNITEIQLKKIVFALNLGQNSFDSDQCHKIGHGKPLGLGSAKIVVNNIKVREFRDGKYSEIQRNDIFINNKTDIFENSKNVRNILKVTDMKAVDGRKINYPKTKKSDDIFKWFADNRKVFKSFGQPMEYYNKLPRLTDDNQELPENPKFNNNSNSTGKPKNIVHKEECSNTLGSCMRIKNNSHKNKR